MLKIFRPIQSNYLGQGFGENKACVNDAGQVLTKTGLTCPVGYKGLYESVGMLGHNGEDWNAWRGEPIYHAGNFEGIADISEDAKGGIGVDIFSTEEVGLAPVARVLGLDSVPAKAFVKIRYWHLKSVAVPDKSLVKPGQIIGYADNTGLSSGDHLHWSLRLTEGLPGRDSSWRTLNTENGYTGSIDFRPWFTNTFVLDLPRIEGELVKAQLTLIDLLKKMIFELTQRIRSR